MERQYIKVRKQIIESNLKGGIQIDLNFFYNYYMVKSKSLIEPQVFQSIFLQGDFRQIIEHLDKHFGVTILVDKDGVELKLIK